jgi:hypothetical protein
MRTFFLLDLGTKSGSDILTEIPRNTVVKLLIHGETTVTTDLLLEPSYAPNGGSVYAKTT